MSSSSSSASLTSQAMDHQSCQSSQLPGEGPSLPCQAHLPLGKPFSRAGNDRGLHLFPQMSVKNHGPDCQVGEDTNILSELPPRERGRAPTKTSKRNLCGCSRCSCELAHRAAASHPQHSCPCPLQKKKKSFKLIGSVFGMRKYRSDGEEQVHAHSQDASTAQAQVLLHS